MSYYNDRIREEELKKREADANERAAAGQAVAAGIFFVSFSVVLRSIKYVIPLLALFFGYVNIVSTFPFLQNLPLHFPYSDINIPIIPLCIIFFLYILNEKGRIPLSIAMSFECTLEILHAIGFTSDLDWEDPWWAFLLIIIVLSLILSRFLIFCPIFIEVYFDYKIESLLSIPAKLLLIVSLYGIFDYILPFMFKDFGWTIFKHYTLIIFLVVSFITFILYLLFSTILTFNSLTTENKLGLNKYCQYVQNDSFATKLKYAWIIKFKVRSEYRRREHKRDYLERKLTTNAKHELSNRKVYIHNPNESNDSVYVRNPHSGTITASDTKKEDNGIYYKRK